MKTGLDSYRHRVRNGDRVRMPNGRLGTVIRFEVRWGGHFLFVWVRPDKPKRGWRSLLPVFNRCFVEEAVDRLELIAIDPAP